MIRAGLRNRDQGGSQSSEDAKVTPKRQSNWLAAFTYAIGDLLTKGAKFILLPLYLRYLTPDQIGALAVLQAISVGLTPVFSSGISMAVPRFSHDYQPRSEQLVATLLCVCLFVSGIGTALLAAAYLILPVEWGELFGVATVLLWLLSGFLRANSTILERRYVIRGEALNFRSLTFLQFALSTALIFAFTLMTDLGLLGIAIAESFAYGVTLVILSVRLFYHAKPDPKIIDWNGTWVYSYPLAIHACMIWAVCYADRLVLSSYVDLPALGIYHVGYMLATVLSTIALSIKNAWLPNFFKDGSEDQQAGKMFSSWLMNYFSFVLFFALGMICIGPLLARSFLTEEYVASLDVMKVILVALVFHAMFIVLLNPLYLACRTKTIAGISAVALGVNLIAMIGLIPITGIFGAAIASIFGYAIACGLAYWQAGKHYALNIDWMLIIRASVLFLVVAGSSVIEHESLFVHAVISVCSILVYIVICVGVPNCFLLEEERRRVLQFLGKKTQAVRGVRNE
ncbi:MAG: oligosaccharide flippase family protein [Rubripirellula sp.]